MQTAVQIFFDSTSLEQLLQTNALHPIVRAAADQQVLRVVAAPGNSGTDNSIAESLERIGIRVYPADDGAGCDYIVTAPAMPDQGNQPGESGKARSPGDPGPTPLSFETLGQYLRKMV